MGGGSNLINQIASLAAGSVLRFFVGVGLLLGVAFGLVAIGNDPGGNAFAALVNPPSVSTGNATAGGYTAWLSGNLDQRGTTATVNMSFQWRTGSDAWSDTPAKRITDNYTGPFSFNLTGLSANTTYEYRAHATGDGEGFGLIETFTTIFSPIAPSVSTLNATAVSDSSATLWWQLLQEGTAPSGKVTIEWGSTPDQLVHEIGPVYQWLRVPGIGFVPGFLDTTAKPVNIYNWNTNDFVPDRIFVKFKDGTDENTMLNVHVNRGGFVINEFPEIGVQVVQVPAGTVLQKVAEYQREMSIEYAEPFGRAGVAGGGVGSGFLVPLANILTPNTTYYFRAKAVGDGISYGEIMSFTTLGGGGSGGGGGGGGGGGTTVVSDVMSGNQFAYPATAKSADQKVNIDIPKGTTAKTETGRLSAITIIVQRELPEAVPSWGEDLRSIGVIYNIQPDGTTFDPPIDFSIKYNSEDAKQIPKGANEKNLVIGTYDMKLGKWVMLDSAVDPENNTVTVKIGHFSLYTIMARTAPASFTVSDLTITPKEVMAGESVAISADVSNTGDLSGGYKIDLKIDGQILDTKEVTVDGRNTQTVGFNLPATDVGTHTVSLGGLEGTYQVIAPKTPAAFAISGLTISPGKAKPGDKVNISVTVTNTGQTNGTYSLLLKINGNTVDAKEAILAGGASDSVVFTASGETAGEYAIDINGTTGSFIVKEETTSAIEPATNPPPVLKNISPIKTPGANWWLIVGSVLVVLFVGSVITILLRKPRNI